MSDPRVISATFSTWRPVQGRKVLQLVFEVPVERTKEVLTMLGDPGDQWVAIALLNEKPVASVAHSTRDSSERSPPQEPPQAQKPKRERTLAEQCAILCEDARFSEYLHDMWGPAFDDSGGNVAGTVRAILRVASRSEINTDTDAATRWRRLVEYYRDWQAQQDYGAMAR